jgi:hypothetical protein
VGHGSVAHKDHRFFVAKPSFALAPVSEE